MVLTNLPDKWAQEKINTAYNILQNCIATTKQRETIQPFYSICYVGSLSDLSVQCPPPVRPETIWATSLCENTVIPVGSVCANGNLFINSSCLKTCRPTSYTFCEETRWVFWNDEESCWLDDCTDHYRTMDCPKVSSYTNCLWTGSSRQYNCRKEVSALCQSQWQEDIMDLSFMERSCCCVPDKECIHACLVMCSECAGTWELPYPCFISCTFCNVSRSQIDSAFLTFCTPDGCVAPTFYCVWCGGGYVCVPYVKCMVSCNPATQNCDYECNLTIPYCYIGWSGLPYCWGGETACCLWKDGCSSWNIIVPCSPLALVCRVIDVYTWSGVGSEDWVKNPIYVINQKILCSGRGQ